MPPQQLSDDPIVDGIAKMANELLPDGTYFALLTYPASGLGKFEHVFHSDRKLTIKMLRDAADTLEKREDAARRIKGILEKKA